MFTKVSYKNARAYTEEGDLYDVVAGIKGTNPMSSLGWRNKNIDFLMVLKSRSRIETRAFDICGF